jgi:hypothetical protein
MMPSVLVVHGVTFFSMMIPRASIIIPNPSMIMPSFSQVVCVGLSIMIPAFAKVAPNANVMANVIVVSVFFISSPDVRLIFSSSNPSF